MAGPERAIPSLLVDIQQTQWILAWQENEHPAAPENIPLLIAAPPSLLLLGTGDQRPAADKLPPPSHGVVFDSSTAPESDGRATTLPEETPFIKRLSHLQPRLERLVRSRWRGDFDAYELDNLVQAGTIYLWKAYERDPAKLDSANDTYWCAIAKRGAFYEITHEYSQRYRREGSARNGKKKYVEVVLSAGDLLAKRTADEGSADLDETSLDCDTRYTHDPAEVEEIDLCIDLPRLVQMIYQGTNAQDHPMITQILDYMREGLTKTQMAERAGVKVSTIRVTIRRIQQACGASQEAKENRKKPSDSLDAKIRVYRERGLGGPEIARLIGTDWTFVYRRLRKMHLM